MSSSTSGYVWVWASAIIGVSLSQFCNYVQPKANDMAYVTNVCRTFVDNAGVHAYKQYTCARHMGSWRIEEEVHRTSDCDDAHPVTTVITPHASFCDAVGSCDYIKVHQYNPDTDCDDTKNYTMDAIATNVCVPTIDDSSGTVGSMRILCGDQYNGTAMMNYCYESAGCQCDIVRKDILPIVPYCAVTMQWDWQLQNFTCSSVEYTAQPTTQPTAATNSPSAGPTKQPIVPTDSPSPSPTSTPVTSEAEEAMALDGTAIGLIVVSIILFVVVFAVVIGCLMKRMKMSNETDYQSSPKS